MDLHNLLNAHQQEYYDVIAQCDTAGYSTAFVEFMLRCLLDTMVNLEPQEIETSKKLHDKVADKVADKL